MLMELGIEDTRKNAEKLFVRAELYPQSDEDLLSNINTWEFNVDQDIVPDWFMSEYEKGRMISSVRNYLNNNIFINENDNKKLVSELQVKDKIILGSMLWSVVKKDENDNAYLLLDRIIKRMRFGFSNKYAESKVRNYLLNCELQKRIKQNYSGDNFIPVYSDDTIGLMTYDIYNENIDNVNLIDSWYWLSDPYLNTAGLVRCVYYGGFVRYGDCAGNGGVRPFCILKSDIFVSLFDGNVE